MQTGTIDGVELQLTPTDRVRSPGDVLRLLTGVVILTIGLALAFWAPGTLGGAEADLARGLSRLPSRWERVLLGFAELAVVATSITVAVFLGVTRRRRLLAWLAGTVVAASALTYGLDLMLTSSRVEVLAGVDTVGEWFVADPNFPSSGLMAGMTAAVVFGSPWLTTRWRRVGWLAVVILVVLRVALSADPSVDVVPAIGMGIVVGAAALLLRGAPSLEPSGDELIRALRQAGIHPTGVRQLSLGVPQLAPGHSTVTYRVTDGGARDVRLGLCTEHDRSADVLTHLWQSLRLRADEVDPPFNTIRQRVEHEALALELAGRGGARVPRLVALVAMDDGSMGIAEDEIVGSPIQPEDPSGPPASTSALKDVWEQVRSIHAAGIAHRDLSLRRVLVDAAGAAWITGFHRARLAASERERALDVAQLLTDTALAVGPQQAVDAAVSALGADLVAAAIPLLQPLALPRSTRRALRKDGQLLEDLRTQVERRCGVAGVELERIERVRPRTVLTVVALTLAFYLVLPQLADLRSTADAFAEANWAWAPWILVGSALSYVFAAVSFVGAVPDTVPFVPALRAQLASSFMSLIAPANSGALALGVRFLQRSGVEAGPAAASVALNTLAGLVVHLALLFVFVLWNGTSGLGDFSLPDASLFLGAIAVLLALTGVAMLHRGLRERVLFPLGRATRTAMSSVGSVLTNPVRVGQLLGGSIGITLAYLVAIMAAVEAFGGGPRLTQVAVGFLVASALASVAPTPGGLGAFEAAMITALTGFGMSSGAAVSATLSYRLATYWLPIPPGWFAFTWMQHHDEV